MHSHHSNTSHETALESALQDGQCVSVCVVDETPDRCLAWSWREIAYTWRVLGSKKHAVYMWRVLSSCISYTWRVLSSGSPSHRVSSTVKITPNF